MKFFFFLIRISTNLEVEKGLRNKDIKEGGNRWDNTRETSLQSQVVYTCKY